jgi:hypothetical protein
MTDCQKQILRIGYMEERFSLCTYPLLNEIYKQFINVHAALQTRQAFCITIRQPLSSTWGLTGTLFGLNRGKVRKNHKLGLHFSCVSFAYFMISGRIVLQSDNPLSSTWGLTGTLFGLNRGNSHKKTYTRFTWFHIEQLFLLCFFCIHFYYLQYTLYTLL